MATGPFLLASISLTFLVGLGRQAFLELGSTRELPPSPPLQIRNPPDFPAYDLETPWNASTAVVTPQVLIDRLNIGAATLAATVTAFG